MPVNLDIKLLFNQYIYRTSFHDTVCTCSLVSQKVVKFDFEKCKQLSKNSDSIVGLILLKQVCLMGKS